MFNKSFLEEPVSRIVSVRRSLDDETTTQEVIKDKNRTISIFDVKKLYDLAHSKKIAGYEDSHIKLILAEALKLDIEYRRQLAGKAEHSKKLYV